MDVTIRGIRAGFPGASASVYLRQMEGTNIIQNVPMLSGGSQPLVLVDITDSFTCLNFLAAVREITGIPTPGRIFCSDVAWRTSLDVSGRNITSLAGIEHFQNLAYLDAMDNQLTALDVSNNLALTILNVEFNQLPTIDISNNTALTSLILWSNQLTNLDVSNNTSLIMLDAGMNQLRSLDVSNNPKLEMIWLPWNQLTTLNISNNPALQRVSIANNLLSSLNIEQNILLTQLVAIHNFMSTPDDVIGWQNWFNHAGSFYVWEDEFQFFPQREREQYFCPDCNEYPCDCNGFGQVPPTGVPITWAMYAMFALAALSAGFWGLTLHSKRRN